MELLTLILLYCGPITTMNANICFDSMYYCLNRQEESIPLKELNERFLVCKGARWGKKTIRTEREPLGE